MFNTKGFLVEYATSAELLASCVRMALLSESGWAHIYEGPGIDGFNLVKQNSFP
jgi:hypothetical protein